MNNKIIVIDDEQGILNLIKFFLQHKGFEVTTVNDGMEAIKLIENNFFDLTFLDINMPKMNGWQVLKKIKEIRPDLKVIIISSFFVSNEELETNIRQLGVFGYLYKPFELDELLQMINGALEIK